MATKRYDPAAIGFPGGSPAFPGTECLAPDSYKVVIASWQRLNPATTPTSDFVCNVAAYAPKLPYVRRVQLVDVQVPNTQRLIESPWCRAYFRLGVPLYGDMRRLDMELQHGARTGVVLPLPIDGIVSVTPVAGYPGVTQVVLQHAAPFPIAAVVGAWPGTIALVGVPLPGGFVLTRDNVADANAGPNAFHVLSYELADALATPGIPDPTCGALVAEALPSDAALAAVLSAAGTAALVGCCGGGNTGACAGWWRFVVNYCGGPQMDRFEITYGCPRGGPLAGTCLRLLPSALCLYLGFDGVPLAPDTRTVAPTPRAQPPAGYARLPNGNYSSLDTLGATLALVMSAYTWTAALEVHVLLPQSPGPDLDTLLTFQGHGTLDVVAQFWTQQLATALPAADIQVRNAGGLRFCSDAGYAFALQFPLTPDALRVGYMPGATTGYAVCHDPVEAPQHIPNWSWGSSVQPCPEPLIVAPCDVEAHVTRDGQLSVSARPFAPFAVTVGPVEGCDASWLLTGPATFAMGLQAGARVALVSADGASTQVPCVVTATDWVANTAVVVQANSLQAFAPGDPTTTVVPLDAPALNMYMQTASNAVGRQDTVPAALLGFDPPETYVAAADGELLSPGTVRVRDDPYILLCLSFHAGDTAGLTGSVYYPFEVPAGGSQLVFAQVLRGACDFRSDYERAYGHAFPGAGINMGFVRVRLLNADGTPYQTHGHPVTVCLRLDVATDGVMLGGPASVSLLGPPCGATTV